MQEEVKSAIEVIKQAILNSQYEASKDVNRVQLGLYFGIGKFLALHKGKETWGTSILETISENLRKQLPGLRGFSATSLKRMREFYENWNMLESKNSSIAMDEFSNKEQISGKSVIAISDLNLQVYIKSFPLEDFFKVPFTHHIQIFSRVKNLEERYFYISKTAQEHLSVTALNKSIERHARENEKSYA